MVTREETTKMRKKLMQAERILTQQERAKMENTDYRPMNLSKEKDRPEPKTNEIPSVIHLPKQRKPKKENIPFY